MEREKRGRDGATFSLCVSLSQTCTHKQGQHGGKDRRGTQRVQRPNTADAAQREKHTHAKPEIRIRTPTRTAGNNARTDTPRHARERERDTHTRVQHVAHTGRDEWVGRTARGRRTFCAQRVRSMRVQAGAKTTQTRTRTRTCDRPLCRPTPTPSARRRRRLARGVGSMSARGRR